MNEHLSASSPSVANARTICLTLMAATVAGLCLLILSIKPIASVLSQAWAYWGLVPVTVMYLLCVIIVSRRTDLVGQHLAIPSVLFLLAMAYFIHVGSFDHWLQVGAGAEFVYLPWLSPAYQLIAFALGAWAVGYLIGRGISGREDAPRASIDVRPVTGLSWDRRRLFLIALFWSVASSISFSVFYFHIIDYFPVIRGVSPNADPDLRAILFGRGRMVSTIAFNSANLALITLGLYLIRFGRYKWLMSMLFLLTVGWLLLWGARLYIALPGMICLVLMIARMRWSLLTTASLLAILAAMAVLYGLARNREFVDIDPSCRTATERLADLHVGPEFRDSLGVMACLDDLREQYRPASYFRGIYFTAVPGRLLSLMGLNKDALFDEEGNSVGWIAARTTRGHTWGAIRPGIIGETLIAFGRAGVVVVFALYGLLFARLDVLCRRYPIASPWSLLVYGSAVIFTYSVVASTHSTFAKYWYFLYGCILTMVLAARRARRPA